MRFKLNAVAATIGASVIALSGCTTNTPRLNELQDELRAKEQQNQELRESLASMQERGTQTVAVAPAAPTAAPAAMSSTGDLLPPNAKSGECYARVWVPATYRTVEEKVLDKEQTSTVSIIPAKYGWATESVMTKEASSRLVTVPAVYGTETQTIKIADAQRLWRTALTRNAPPASAELLATAAKHGIDLDAASPGMCFHEHFRPATYGTEQTTVLVSEASESISVSGAKYRTVEKTVLVKEASYKLVDVPATYKTVSEKVIDKPAHTIWKKGSGPIQRIDESTGEIMCLVDIPATYKIITKRINVTPAGTKRIEIPAEYKTVKVRELVEEARASSNPIPEKHKTVSIRKKLSDAEFVWHEVHKHGEPTETRTGLKICLTETPAKYKTVTRRIVKTPASFKKVEIPAEYKNIKSRKLVAEAKEVRHDIPATYKMVSHQELMSEGHMQWRSILCETNMTTNRIRQIQQALKKAGYNPGPIDGVIGKDTVQAVNAFQKDNKLPMDRYLNIQTIRALGVSPK